MSDNKKRDSAYWLGRLEQDGRKDLIAKINAGDISVYRATFDAGYRKKRSAPSTADRISHHYTRATIAEKRRFIVENWSSVAHIVGDLAKRKRARDEAQKPAE